MPNLFALMSGGSDHPIAAGGATSFGATINGRTGGLESEGRPEVWSSLSHRVSSARNGAAAGLPNIASTWMHPFGGDTDGEAR
jgi:hypothetical protein